MFITFEAIDTAGKSTQANLLKNNLKSKGFEKVEVIHFPDYDSMTGQVIKDIITTDKIHDIDKTALQFFYIADQINAQNDINTLLEHGYVVIADRYDLSSLVYALSGIEGKYLSDLHFKRKTMADVITKAQMLLRKPDITFILDLDSQEVKRRKGTLDKLESNDKFMKKVSHLYKEIEVFLNNDKRKIGHLDASLPKEDVAKQVLEEICRFYKLL